MSFPLSILAENEYFSYAVFLRMVQRFQFLDSFHPSGCITNTAVGLLESHYPHEFQVGLAFHSPTQAIFPPLTVGVLKCRSHPIWKALMDCTQFSLTLAFCELIIYTKKTLNMTL